MNAIKVFLKCTRIINVVINEATGTYVALQCFEMAVITYMLILANHLKNIIVPCYSNGALPSHS